MAKFLGFNITKEKRAADKYPTVAPVDYTHFQTLLQQSFNITANKAKVRVTGETALTLSAFYSCVRNISEDIAKLPFKVMETNPKNGNRYPIYTAPAFKLFGMKPNDASTPFTFIETLIQSALIYGNGYAYIERNEQTGEPISVYYLENFSVQPTLYNRKLYYIVNDVQLGITGTFTSDNILHLRGMGSGYIGKSVISYAAESIGKAIATQEFGANFFGSNGIDGIIEFTGLKDETKLRSAKESFKRTYEEDKLAATNGATKFTKITIPNNEAQFIESQDFNVADIARWFRHPLSKLQKDTTSGTEAEAISYVNDCLYPWVRRLEQEIEAKLIPTKDHFLQDATFSFDALLKGDSAAQERRIKTMFMTGAWSIKQILREMNYNTIGEEGDIRLIPVNMIPLDKLDEFWQGKLAADNQSTTASPDASGSGNVNGNIGNRSALIKQLTELAEQNGKP